MAGRGATQYPPGANSPLSPSDSLDAIATTTGDLVPRALSDSGVAIEVTTGFAFPCFFDSADSTPTTTRCRLCRCRSAKGGSAAFSDFVSARVPLITDTVKYFAGASLSVCGTLNFTTFGC